MTRYTVYEWAAERMDGEDIIDVRHADRLRDLWPADDDERLVLVRDKGDVAGGLRDRMWAYVWEDMLPECFSYDDISMGVAMSNGVPVPKRFHREIARVACRGGR